MRLPSLRGLLRRFAFGWRITEYLETLQPAEESVILRRKLAMYRIKRNAIKLARKNGVALSRPYASWNSEATHIQSPSIDESHFHELVLEDGKRTTGRFSDMWVVRFVDGEQYAMKAVDEMQRMVSEASKR